MSTVLLRDYGRPNLEFARPAEPSRLEHVAAALRARGVEAVIADNGAHAKAIVLGMIPDGAEVHSALSETLAQLGLTAEIDESGRYDSVRSKLKKLDRETQRRELRKLGAAPDYMLGSVHAITDDGAILVASGSGSQLGAHAYAAGKVIFVVGHQKIVRDVEEGLRRIREYSLPLEDARMKALGRPGSALMKTLIIDGEPGGRITVVLVPETLGF
jgi:L-lactate utilization protein LutC